MKLAPNMIAGVTSRGAGALEPKQADARKADRTGLTSCLPFATVRDGAIGSVTTVLARNLSPTGISFLSSTELCQGQEFMVWLMTANGNVAVYCQVVWREALNRSSYLVGGVYTRLGTKEEAALISAGGTTAPSSASV